MSRAPGQSPSGGELIRIDRNLYRAKGKLFELGGHQIDGRGLIIKGTRGCDETAGKIEYVVFQCIDRTDDFFLHFA
jgi:hypothetical protein